MKKEMRLTAHDDDDDGGTDGEGLVGLAGPSSK